MLNFPSSPTLNQSYSATQSEMWRYDGVAWVGGPGFIVVEEEANYPVEPHTWGRISAFDSPAATQETGRWVEVGDEWSIDPSGYAFVNFQMPPGARLLRITGTAFLPATNNFVVMTVSVDGGTTYLSGATDYSQAGYTAYAGTNAWVNSPLANAPYQFTHTSGDYNAVLPSHFESLFLVERIGTNYKMICFSHGGSYYNNAVYYDADTMIRSSLNVGASPGGLRITHIKFAAYTGTFMTGSRILIEVLSLWQDPYWGYVRLLAGFDGPDATTTSWEDARWRYFTFVTGAELDTAQAIGVSRSSLYCNGAGYAYQPDNADWVIGSNQFTIECWFRPQISAPSYGHGLVSQGTGTDVGFALRTFAPFIPFADSQAAVEPLAGEVLRFDLAGSVANVPQLTLNYPWYPTPNLWYHVAVDRDVSGMVRLYLNGVMVASGSATTPVRDSAQTLNIGKDQASNATLLGWIDEVRFTVGAARYASDAGFTVPTAPFPRG